MTLSITIKSILLKKYLLVLLLLGPVCLFGQSNEKTYPYTDTIGSSIYNFISEYHIIREDYKTKDLKIKSSVYEYISQYNYPNKIRKLIAISHYFESGQIRSKTVFKRIWHKSTIWDESGEKMRKSKTRYSNSRSRVIIIWTFRKDGKITLKRSKKKYSPFY